VRGEGESPVDVLASLSEALVAGVGWIFASLWSVGVARMVS